MYFQMQKAQQIIARSGIMVRNKRHARFWEKVQLTLPNKM